MLSQALLEQGLPIGRMGAEVHFYSEIGSTNDRAAKLAAKGAPEGALVVADAQRAGRGRLGRRWNTPAGTGIALSLVMRPVAVEPAALGALGLVGAMATIDALGGMNLRPLLKWPNDVVLEGRKVAGVLAEASWSGSHLDYLILGIGVNVRPVPDENYDFPATNVEQSFGEQVDRGTLLFSIVASLDEWYDRFLAGEAHPAWEEHLAYKAEWVTVSDGEREYTGRPLGLTSKGGLRLEMAAGQQVVLEAGAYQLRPKSPRPQQPI